MIRDVTGRDTIQSWLEAFDLAAPAPGSAEWRDERLRRLHAQQMILDVIAHVQNIPLRLLRIDNLVSLDQTFVRFIRKWSGDVLRLFTDTAPDASHRVPKPLTQVDAHKLIASMQDPRHLKTLQQWILSLADPSIGDDAAPLQRPESLPPHYVEWFLMLLPHLERDVWLTEMGNPLPAHTLARTVEHCSLFILMWAWSKAPEFKAEADRLKGHSSPPAEELRIFREALGLRHLGLCVLPSFVRKGNEQDLDVAMVAGPFLMESVIDDDTSKDGGLNWLVSPILNYLSRVERVVGVEGWDEVQEKAPGATEFKDALESRASIDDNEARRRAIQSHSALRRLLNIRMDASLFQWDGVSGPRPISRANWESMAVLAAWFDRWGWIVYQDGRPNAESHMEVAIDRHRVKMLVGGPGKDPQLLYFAYAAPKSLSIVPSDIVPLSQCLEVARAAHQWRWIEGPETFFARMRERQQAAWTAHVAAINHLLARHSRRDRPEGANDPGARHNIRASCEEADHLLRGFGGRVCRYLLSMARADVAEIYWLDYRSAPPRLRHVGSAERLIQHRARRQEMLTRYEDLIWESRGSNLQDGVREGITLDENCRFQMYRAVANAQVQPTPPERKAAHASAATSPQFAWPSCEGDDNPPLDAVSVPLMFNERVVGVFCLGGIASTRHFDLRMYPAFRLVAQVLAQAIYFHSQVWHMRQLNWLASHVPLEEWRNHSSENRFNPLERVARCLGNVFLCDGVQIWLADEQNSRRYYLHGTTAPFLFDENGEPPEHAPRLYVRPHEGKSQVDLSRSVLAFAVDQWTVNREDASSNAEARPSRSDASATQPGQFVQARYQGGETPTQNYKLECAQRGALVLQRDFIDASLPAQREFDDSLPALRRQLFEVLGWTQVMAFALVTINGTTPEVVGLIALYGRGRRYRDHDVPEHVPWPPGWRPVVAHMQSYLPYLFTQAEAIANPLDNMRRYLLHEGRNELMSASEQASQLRAALQDLLAPDALSGQFRVRPWIRQILPKLQSAPDEAPITDIIWGLGQIDRGLTEVSDKTERLMAVERGENMAMLARLIERQREISRIGLAFDKRGRYHDMESIRMHDSIRELFVAYAEDLRKQRVWWSVDKVPGSVLFLTQPRIWRWLIGDLVHNIVKYASPDSGAEAELVEPARRGDRVRLRFRNVSSYDPELDVAERLIKHGTQGSAAHLRASMIQHRTKVSRVGSGIGLWGVKLLAEAMHLELQIQIIPRKNPKEAVYYFDLYIDSQMIRRGSEL